MAETAAIVETGATSRSGWSEQIVDYLFERERLTTLDEIRSHFSQFDPSPVDTTIRGRLSDLASQGTIIRFKKAVYVHPKFYNVLLSQQQELASDIEEAIETIEPQVPAVYRFEVQDGKISAIPMTDVASDPLGAQVILDETRRKALELQERVDHSNAPLRVKRSVDGLLAVLPEDVTDLNEHLLRSRFRSIESDAKAYAEDEAELFPDAVAQLIDVSETLKDLQSFYPNLRDMEAEISAIDIRPDQIDQALDLADSVVAAVDEVPDAIDAALPEAMRQLAQIPREEAAISVRQKRAAEYWLVVHNFASTAFRGALDLAFTQGAKRLASDAYSKMRPKIVEAPGIVVDASVVLLAAKMSIYMGVPGAAEVILTMGFAKVFGLSQIAKKMLDKYQGKGKSDKKDDKVPLDSAPDP